MSHEVHGLGNFYATPAGLVTARLLRDRLRSLWPALPGQAVLGLGYASPFLRLWRAEAARCVALVPPHLPRWRWPRSAASCTAVAEEDTLPFPDLMFDRILLVHGLETAENARRLLREAWRVLKDDGRIIVVAPNRLGLWAHLERTPFGHGQPYTPDQLARLLQRQMFQVEARVGALFVPPLRSRLLLRGAMALERLGSRLCPRFAGVTAMEAVKDFAALVPTGERPAQARRVVVAEGVWQSAAPGREAARLPPAGPLLPAA
ncbi:class I SAM-dependent methyltransferase [Roseicella aquatilis]|uniref:Methyltransferase domain-containing protein n=1 Tax=Roseicella aquatilis TaxID=2527868 RepID=A0A4R4DVM3_9PROT|nr:methyltransferase domain-containing protein [Roseicella aquatilis]TCZ66581.1 methyltransferase domain-containing protein [Roseicella aquatilis]